jgi:hypothetical protein
MPTNGSLWRDNVSNKIGSFTKNNAQKETRIDSVAGVYLSELNNFPVRPLLQRHRYILQDPPKVNGGRNPFVDTKQSFVS